MNELTRAQETLKWDWLELYVPGRIESQCMRSPHPVNLVYCPKFVQQQQDPIQVNHHWRLSSSHKDVANQITLESATNTFCSVLWQFNDVHITLCWLHWCSIMLSSLTIHIQLFKKIYFPFIMCLLKMTHLHMNFSPPIQIYPMLEWTLINQSNTWILFSDFQSPIICFISHPNSCHWLNDT